MQCQRAIHGGGKAPARRLLDQGDAALFCLLAQPAAKIRLGLRAKGDLKGEDRTIRRLVNLNWTPAQLEDARKHGGGEGVVLTRYGAYREETQALAHRRGGKGLVAAGLQQLHAGLPDHVVIVDDEGRRELRLQHRRMLSSDFGRWE